MSNLSFKLIKKDGEARRAEMETAHGTVQTPAFMPVGTQATVKAVTPAQVEETGAEVVLANAYHMSLNQRMALVERHGGLHSFMRWNKTILTDSGGFQVFSLPKTITEEGVSFSYQENGEQVKLSPEISMDVQKRLGADIIMAFDECVEYPTTREYLEQSVDRTARWLERCTKVDLQDHQNLFGIIQGGIEEDLRKKSVEQICSIDLPGYAIGGVSVGEGHELLKKIVSYTAQYMPENKPRYLMGVGLPEDIFESVERGVDMFDCVIPTRYGREGTVFIPGGKMRIKDKKFRKDRYPIDTKCQCYTCKEGFSRAYLRHLLFSGEPLGETLLTIHNLHYYQNMMRLIRENIEKGTFAKFKKEFLGRGK